MKINQKYEIEHKIQWGKYEKTNKKCDMKYKKYWIYEIKGVFLPYI